MGYEIYVKTRVTYRYLLKSCHQPGARAIAAVAGWDARAKLLLGLGFGDGATRV